MLFYTEIFKVQPPGAGRQQPESVYMGGLSQSSAQIKQAAAVGRALNDRGDFQVTKILWTAVR